MIWAFNLKALALTSCPTRTIALVSCFQDPPSWPPCNYSLPECICHAETWLRDCHICLTFLRKARNLFLWNFLLFGTHQRKQISEAQKTHVWPMDQRCQPFIRFRSVPLKVQSSNYLFDSDLAHVVGKGSSHHHSRPLNSRPLKQDIWVLDRICILNKLSRWFYAI